MQKVYFTRLLLSLAFLSLVACKKKTEEEVPQPIPVEPTTSAFKLELVHKAGAQDFSMNEQYSNSSGETFKIITLRYLISKVKLRKSDDTEIDLSQYFLVDPSTGTPLQVANVPFGEYTGMSYSIGVDSLTNTRGAQSGTLDAINSMDWSDWGGFINFELLGTSPSSTASTKIFEYSINGFRYPYSTEQIIFHSFGSNRLTIQKGNIPFVRISVDILELFKNPVDISIASVTKVLGSGVNSKKIADNYQDMFTFDAIHN